MLGNRLRSLRGSLQATALTILVASCVPVPVPFADPKLNYYGSDDEDNAAKNLVVPPGKSLIYVIQEYTVSAPGGSEIIVLLDGHVVRELAPRAYVALVTEPGSHTLRSVSANTYVSGPLGTSNAVRIGRNLSWISSQQNLLFLYHDSTSNGADRRRYTKYLVS
jgi:hypothetical protein